MRVQPPNPGHFGQPFMQQSMAERSSRSVQGCKDELLRVDPLTREANFDMGHESRNSCIRKSVRS